MSTETSSRLNRIHETACEVQGWVAPELPTHLVGVIDWVDHVLAPHLSWEEAWLFPELDGRTGTAWATRPAQFDHQQIRSMVDRIREDRALLQAADASARLPELKCRLFGLEALLRSHIEREERFLIPILAE